MNLSTEQTFLQEQKSVASAHSAAANIFFLIQHFPHLYTISQHSAGSLGPRGIDYMRPYEHHLRSTRRCTFSVVKLTTTNKGVEPLDRTEELKSKGYVLLLAHGPPLPAVFLVCKSKDRSLL